MLGCIVYIVLSGVVCVATNELCRKLAHEKVKSLGYVSLLEKKNISFRTLADNFIPIWSNLKTFLSLSSIVEIFSLRDEELKKILDKNVNFMKFDFFDKNAKHKNENNNSISNEVNLKKEEDKVKENDDLFESLNHSPEEASLNFNLPDYEIKTDSIERGKVKAKRLYPSIEKNRH